MSYWSSCGRLAEAGSAVEGGEGDVDEGVVAGGLFAGCPELGLGDAADQREGGADAAELLDDLGGVGEFVGAREASALCDEVEQRLEDRQVLLEAAFALAWPSEIDVVPVAVACDASDQRERGRDAAELLDEFLTVRELGRARQLAVLLNERLERLECFLVLLVNQLGDSLSVWSCATGLVGEQSLGGVLVAEDVEDAGRGGDAAGVEGAVDPGPQLVLGVVLLEGVGAGEDPVAVLAGSGAALFPVETRGDDERFVCEPPCVLERVRSLAGVFDHVDDIADVDDVRGLSGGVRCVAGVPAARLVAELR